MAGGNAWWQIGMTKQINGMLKGKYPLKKQRVKDKLRKYWKSRGRSFINQSRTLPENTKGPMRFIERFNI